MTQNAFGYLKLTLHFDVKIMKMATQKKNKIKSYFIETMN